MSQLLNLSDDDLHPPHQLPVGRNADPPAFTGARPTGRLPGVAVADRCPGEENTPEDLAWWEFQTVKFQPKELVEVEGDPEVQRDIGERPGRSCSERSRASEAQ
jgi:hypothetical protein